MKEKDNQMSKTLKDLQAEKRQLLVKFDRICSMHSGADHRVQNMLVLIRENKRAIAKMGETK